MNIFWLDKNHLECVRSYVDKHVVKLPLEYGQILCTVLHLKSDISKNDIPYRKTHINHPVVKWASSSHENYMNLYVLGKYVCSEYTFRYKRIHKCEPVIDWCFNNRCDLPSLGFTDPPLCMPKDCQIQNDYISSYREYYNKHKRHLFNWKNRSIPDWIIT